MPNMGVLKVSPNLFQERNFQSKASLACAKLIVDNCGP